MATCPPDRTFQKLVYLDELQQSGVGVEACLPPATPKDALERYGLRTRATLVRLMRRNFVVLAQPGLVVVELPTLSAALAVWLSAARTHEPSENWQYVPDAFRPLVEAIRSQRPLPNSTA